jgi:hypothetical protein
MRRTRGTDREEFYPRQISLTMSIISRFMGTNLNSAINREIAFCSGQTLMHVLLRQASAKYELDLFQSAHTGALTAHDCTNAA